MDELILDGMLWIWADNNDFLLGSVISEIDKAPAIKKFIPTWNQNKELNWQLRSSCTVFNSFRAACSVLWIQPDTNMWQDLWDYAKEKGWYREGIGNYTAHGVNVARKFIKDVLKKDLLSFTTPLFTQDYLVALSKNYPIVVSFRGNRQYNVDYQADNVLDYDSFWAPTYWHCTVHTTEDNKVMIDDSVHWERWNRYEIKKLWNLVKNQVFYPNAYVFVADPNGTIKTEYEKYREEVEIARKRAMERWLTNWLDWEKPVLREQMRVTLYRNNK